MGSAYDRQPWVQGYPQPFFDIFCGWPHWPLARWFCSSHVSLCDFERNFFLTPNSKNSFLCHTKTGFGSSGHFIRIPTYFFASNSSVARWMDCEANLQPCLQGHVGGQEDCEPWVCGWWQFAPCQNSAGNADHWPLATEGFKVGQRSGPFRFVPDQGCDKVSDVE